MPAIADKPISKPQDQMLRQWLKTEHRYKVPMYYFWNLTPAQAVEALQREEPKKFSKLTADDVEIAARRK